jgi:ABC-type Fe2+-enterobactin transport system substrate-binding protein
MLHREQTNRKKPEFFAQNHPIAKNRKFPNVALWINPRQLESASHLTPDLLHFSTPYGRVE